MSEEFERLVAELERFQTKIKTIQEQAVDLDEMRGEVERLEATATSPDRSVTVVAGPAGAIRDIRFTQAALDQEAVQFVSGDGPALGNAAGNFGSIGKGLQKFAEEFPTSKIPGHVNNAGKIVDGGGSSETIRARHKPDKTWTCDGRVGNHMDLPLVVLILLPAFCAILAIPYYSSILPWVFRRFSCVECCNDTTGRTGRKHPSSPAPSFAIC